MKRLSIGLLILVLSFSSIAMVAAQTDVPTEEPTTDATAEATTESSTEADATAEATTEAAARPYLGVRFGPNEDGDGVVIAEVVVDSPAEAAGLQAGDVVTAVNGEELGNGSLADSVEALQPGDVLTLTIERDGESQDIDVTLGTAPETFANRGGRGGRGQRGGQNGGQNGFPETFEFDFSNRPFLGVSLNDTDARAEVQEVVADSPAEAAGIEAGDVITAVNGEAVTDAQSVVDAIAALEADTEVTITVERDGESQDLTATLEAGSAEMFFPGLGELGELPGFPGNGGPGGRLIIPGMGGLQMAPMILGVEGAILNETTAREFNVEQQDGFYVSRVLTDSPAADAGLQAGDVITSINGTAVNEDLNLRDLLQSMSDSDTVSLEVQRDGETMTLELDLPEITMPRFQDRLPSPDEPTTPTDEAASTAA
jgi:S1-C subfamily serine protease